MFGPPYENRKRAVALSILVTAVAIVGFWYGAVGTISATHGNNTTNVSDVAPYYNDSNATVQNDSWMEGNENATLANVTGMIPRLSTFIVGTAPAEGGGSDAGALITGLLMLGVFVGSVSSAGLGMVGGTVLATATGSVLTIVGVAPTWMYAVILMGLGLLLARVYLRSVR